MVLSTYVSDTYLRIRRRIIIIFLTYEVCHLTVVIFSSDDGTTTFAFAMPIYCITCAISMLKTDYSDRDTSRAYLAHVLEVVVVVALNDGEGYKNVVNETRAPADDEQHDNRRQHLDHLQQ